MATEDDNKNLPKEGIPPAHALEQELLNSEKQDARSDVAAAMSEKEPAKEGPKVKKLTDVLLQNQEEKEHTMTEKVANQSAWEHLTPEPEPVKKEQYHQFPAYFYAGFWMRLWAYLFDLVCIFFISGIIRHLLGYLIALPLPLVTVLHTGIYLSYFILLTKLNQGQTLGKVAFGLRVICFTEAELSWTTVFVREGAARFVLQLGFFYLTYGVSAFSNKKQHLGDFFADTSVVTINHLKAYQGLAH